ncbi:MAG: class IV adenylate cyclase [Thermodesulfobacteriota bacterium]
MALEVELKFQVQDFQRIRDKLQKAKASYLDRYFEQNLVLDTGSKELRQKDMLLRLRKSRRSVLCLKRRPRSWEPWQEGFKVYQEHETELQDPEQMQAILENLGYTPAFRYEKVREKWSLEDCLVCLDLLPFGHFVELEGERIRECCRLLGLDPDAGSTKTYHELHLEYRQAQGWAAEDSFVFPEAKRKQLIEQNPDLC